MRIQYPFVLGSDFTTISSPCQYFFAMDNIVISQYHQCIKTPTTSIIIPQVRKGETLVLKVNYDLKYF